MRWTNVPLRHAGGHCLPGFTLLRKIGAGGMGTVYLANHLATNQECALKVINPRLAGVPFMVDGGFAAG